MSGVTWHHRPPTAHTVELRRAWHDITAFGKHTRSNEFRFGMPSSPLGSKHERTTSGLALHYLPRTSCTVGRRRAWHEITTLGLQTWSAMSVVAWHYLPLKEHTVGRRWAWHDITTLGLHARSDDVGSGMISLPLDSTHAQQRRAWNDITALG